jgi:hypothetical protein
VPLCVSSVLSMRQQLLIYGGSITRCQSVRAQMRQAQAGPYRLVNLAGMCYAPRRLAATCSWVRSAPSPSWANC